MKHANPLPVKTRPWLKIRFIVMSSHEVKLRSLPRNLLFVLRACRDLVVVPEVQTLDILNLMDGSRVRDTTYWNRYIIGAEAIPDCYYVDCAVGSGDYLLGMTGQKVEYADMRSRKVRLVVRQQHRLQVRKSPPMGLELLVIELLRIPGLEQYVKKEGWLKRYNVKMRDLLQKLFARLVKLEEKSSDLWKRLRDAQFDRDCIRGALAEAEKLLEERRSASRCLPPSSTPTLPPATNPFRLQQPPNYRPSNTDTIPPVPRRAPSPPQFDGNRTYEDFRRENYGDADSYDRRGNPRYRPNKYGAAPGRWPGYDRQRGAGPSYRSDRIPPRAEYPHDRERYGGGNWDSWNRDGGHHYRGYGYR